MGLRPSALRPRLSTGLPFRLVGIAVERTAALLAQPGDLKQSDSVQTGSIVPTCTASSHSKRGTRQYDRLVRRARRFREHHIARGFEVGAGAVLLGRRVDRHEL